MSARYRLSAEGVRSKKPPNQPSAQGGFIDLQAAPGLFNLVRASPNALRYENQLILAEGDYVMAHGRFSGSGPEAAWIAADIVRFEDDKLAEHWDVLQDEATKAQSKSGRPMFGDRFPD
jgi:predicted SnoaL-like aldol condensation-catalyzing enzyme